MRYALCFITAFTVATSAIGYPAAQTSASTETRPAAARTRIGVYDSRAVALAYYNAPEFQKETQLLRSDLDAAKASNNQARVRDLEFRGPAMQNLLHYQVFSNASIPNVLEKLTATLPTVAAEAGVAMIVSKWDVAFRTEDIEYVDVTDRLVQPFNPSARIQRMIADLKTQKPMPLMEAVRTLRPER